MQNTIYTLTISCPDKNGIIARVTNSISNSGGNIVSLAQYSSKDINTFFCRIEFSPIDDSFTTAGFIGTFEEIAEDFDMDWHIYSSEEKQRMAILVSKTSHCLYEILLKHQDGQLHCDIPVIISNHKDLCGIASEFHIPFYCVDPQKGKAEYEEDVNNILSEYKIDVVSLARYMQILSPEFTKKWENRVINIHHGFLPAFKGAKPYQQAWQKGVKIIGATAHFATADLDQGPIIYQDVIRVSDNCSIEKFIEIGKDIEREVIVEGLKRYFDHKIFIHGGRTFIVGHYL